MGIPGFVLSTGRGNEWPWPWSRSECGADFSPGPESHGRGQGRPSCRREPDHRTAGRQGAAPPVSREHQRRVTGQAGPSAGHSSPRAGWAIPGRMQTGSCQQRLEAAHHLEARRVWGWALDTSGTSGGEGRLEGGPFAVSKTTRPEGRAGNKSSLLVFRKRNVHHGTLCFLRRTQPHCSKRVHVPT